MVHHAVRLVQVVSVHSQTATCTPEHFYRPDPLTPRALTSAHLPSVCVKHPLCTVDINHVRQLWPRGWLVQHACSKDPPSCKVLLLHPFHCQAPCQAASLTQRWVCGVVLGGVSITAAPGVEEEAWRVRVRVESVRPGGPWEKACCEGKQRTPLERANPRMVGGSSCMGPLVPAPFTAKPALAPRGE